MTGSPPILAHLLQAEQHEEGDGGEAALDPLLQRHLHTQPGHVSRATCHVLHVTTHRPVAVVVNLAHHVRQDLEHLVFKKII